MNNPTPAQAATSMLLEMRRVFAGMELAKLCSTTIGFAEFLMWVDNVNVSMASAPDGEPHYTVRLDSDIDPCWVLTQYLIMENPAIDEEANCVDERACADIAENLLNDARLQMGYFDPNDAFALLVMSCIANENAEVVEAIWLSLNDANPVSIDLDMFSALKYSSNVYVRYIVEHDRGVDNIVELLPEEEPVPSGATAPVQMYRRAHDLYTTGVYA